MNAVAVLRKHWNYLNHERSAVLLFLILLVQRFSLSFNYFPVADDWFLYYGRSVYPAGERMLDLVTRPFAGLLDLYFVTPLADHMFLVELVLIVMLCSAAYFFCKAFDRAGIACGAGFMLVLTMTPTAFEGLYWIAAAVRIIPSIFFISASALALTLYLEKGDKISLCLYILCGLFSVGFYEIFVPIYFLVNLFLILRYKKSYWLLFIPLCFSGLMLAYYMFHKGNPEVSGRAVMIESGDWIDHTIYTIKEYEKLLFHTNAALIRESFGDGMAVLLGRPLSLLVLLLLSAAIGFISENKKRYSGRLNLYIGVLLILAGMALSFCLGFVRLPFRLVAPMLIGTAVTAELILSRSFGKYGYKLCVFLMAFFFAVCNIGELSLYKQTNEHDKDYVNQLAMVPEVYDYNYITFLCNAKEYWYNDRVQQLEYVKAATESYGAVTGMVQYLSGSYQINNIIPLYDNAVISDEMNFEDSSVNMIYLNENNEFEPCSVSKTEDGYVISDQEGRPIGSLTMTERFPIYHAGF